MMLEQQGMLSLVMGDNVMIGYRFLSSVFLLLKGELFFLEDRKIDSLQDSDNLWRASKVLTLPSLY